MTLTKSDVYDRCCHYLDGHTPESAQKKLLKVADFSDPHQKMDHYGHGELVESFEAKIARHIGKPAGVFFPTGTMAQQITMRYWAQKSGRFTFAMHPTCHLNLHEEHGYHHLHGLQSVLTGNIDQLISLKDLKEIRTPIAALILELPQRHAGGILPEWKSLCEISEWARANDIKMHMDGARLWEAQNFYGKPLAEIATLFDSVYVSFYKGLGGIGGAMLLGSEDLARESRVWQRRHGGNLVHFYPFVLSADLGFETYVPKMPAYMKRAKEIAAVIDQLSEMTVAPRNPQTNMMHISFKQPLKKVEVAALEASAETGVWLLGGLWQREFFKDPIWELYVGDGALEMDIEQIVKTLSVFNLRLLKE